MPSILQRFIAAASLLLFSPLFLLTAAAILLLDGRPLMFNQERLGLHRTRFKVFKFRTMRDQQVTSIGRLLRASGIDELPQLLNVVTGDMNLVGPRPLTPADTARLGWDDAYHAKRWSVKPGVTGLAQLFAGHSKKLSWAMDNRYLQTASGWQDMTIMLLTWPMQILGKYRVRGWLFGQARCERVYGQRRYAKSAQQVTKSRPAASAYRPFEPDWQRWHTTFARRAKRVEPKCQMVEPLGLDAQQREILLRSLAIFQLGEGGEGRIAHQIDHANINGIDDDYRQALKYFVAEEGRHARLLGRCIKAMGGKLLTGNWTEKCFVHARRLIGIRLKLLVLLVAEVVAVTCYQLIARQLPPSDLRLTLHEICDDETVHLQFHSEFFRTQTQAKWQRALFLSMWWSVACAACVVVLLDHRTCFKALQIDRRQFIRRAFVITKETGRLSIGHAEFAAVAARLRTA